VHWCDLFEWHILESCPVAVQLIHVCNEPAYNASCDLLSTRAQLAVKMVSCFCCLHVHLLYGHQHVTVLIVSTVVSILRTLCCCHVELDNCASTDWHECTILPTCQLKFMNQLLTKMRCCRCEACTRCAGWWLLIHRSSLGRTVSILVCWWCKSEGACLPASARVAAETHSIIRSLSLGETVFGCLYKGRKWQKSSICFYQYAAMILFVSLRKAPFWLWPVSVHCCPDLYFTAVQTWHDEHQAKHNIINCAADHRF